MGCTHPSFEGQAENIQADHIPSDGATRNEDAMTLARRLLIEPSQRHQIFVVSDGGFEGAAELAKRKESSSFRWGGGRPHLGITRMQARRGLPYPIGYEILVEVANAADEPAERRLELDLDDEPIDVVPLQLKPGEHTTQVFEKTSADGGLLRDRLNRDDALAVDNTAFALLPKCGTCGASGVTGGPEVPLFRLRMTVRRAKLL